MRWAEDRFERYLAHLVSARQQSLNHFVAKADWSDEEMLRRVSDWVTPKLGLSSGRYWIIDDTSFPKKEHHSVGVARQYCGVLGKQDNCQVAVSVSLASDTASLPMTWQLYLPQAWDDDPERRRKAGVPDSIGFLTKTQIALQHVQRLIARQAVPDCVLADAGYGVDTAFRQQLSEMGLTYMVGITSAISVWPPHVEPLPPLAHSGRGRVQVHNRAACHNGNRWRSKHWRWRCRHALFAPCAGVKEASRR